MLGQQILILIVDETEASIISSRVPLNCIHEILVKIEIKN